MAAPAPTFSALYTDATKWNEPAPDYTFYSTRVGGAATGAGGLDRYYMTPVEAETSEN